MKLERFSELLRKTDNIEQRDQKGRTALFRAARIGKAEIVRLLLDHGADPNAEDLCGEAPLQAASRYGHIECVEMLIAAGAKLDHYPPPETSEYSETALCSAVRNHPDIAKILLTHGANPNAASSARRLPLIFAASDENRLDVLMALLGAGASVNEQNEQGRTALHAAIDAGSIPLIETLLQHGADPEIESLHAGTALCAAILNYESDRASLVEVLLPARPNFAAACPSWNMTPIELAKEFELLEVIKLLLAAGSPQPRPSDLASDESIESIIEAPDRPANVVVRLVSMNCDPSTEDRALAHEICNKPPALCKRSGWRESPHHWRILKALESPKDPIPLSRIAYFVRGHLNARAGRELEDGPQLLGQSYQDAVSRMVEECLIVQVADEEALIVSATTSQLEKMAKKNGIKSTGTKKVLVERLIAHLGIQQVKQRIDVAAHFRITPEGIRMLKEQKTHLTESINKLKKYLLELLSNQEFVLSCHMGYDLCKILGRGSSRDGGINEDRFATCIANARVAHEAPIPPEMQLPDDMENRARSISAAVSLLDDKENDWSHWDPTVGNIYNSEGEPIKPSDFRLILRFAQEE